MFTWCFSKISLIWTLSLTTNKNHSASTKTVSHVILLIESQPTIIIIPHILITINRLIWLDNGLKSEHVITQDKNHISWNKNHIPPLRKPRGFSRHSYVLWQENVRGTRNASFEGNRYNVVFKYLRQRSNGHKICLPAVFYILVYVFSWFNSV
jgi:hypothetical protein